MTSEFSPSPASGIRWRSEPFRAFFPLGVLLGWAGISHWLFYAAGWITEYSCELHGLIQMQAFTMAFAMGFLLTALPRRTGSAPPSPLEMGGAMALLVAITATALLGHMGAMQGCYIALFVLLLQFAVRRFAGGAAKRKPPAAFVLVPIGILHGLVGAALFLASIASGAPTWARPLARIFIEQGVFLSFIVGIGGLVLPLVGGFPPPGDLGSSPRETRRALGYAATGILIVASEVLEVAGWVRSGPVGRGLVVALALALGGGAWKAPRKPGFHRRLIWLAMWLTPAGVALSGLFPDYRVPALHVTFIGGFSLMIFAVGTHVSFAHLDLEHLMDGRHPAVVAVAVGVLLALATRVAADWSETYFEHLAWAAALWIGGTAVWLSYFGRKFFKGSSG